MIEGTRGLCTASLPCGGSHKSCVGMTRLRYDIPYHRQKMGASVGIYGFIARYTYAEVDGMRNRECKHSSL
jgi:hypothetical protein